MQLDVVTPRGLVLSDTAEEVYAPGYVGEFGVLPGHHPFLTAVKTGELRYKKGNDWKFLACAGGFIEVTGDKVLVLAYSCEPSEGIDVGRAQAALERAEAKLRDAMHTEDAVFKKYSAKVERATARIAVASKR
ncbi:MAG: F0F1 ATP synthase subunit epsilon [Deltaproteobacteria bacterium]|nr:F0F1 ATP synthase subunit epsilon [Deltaproteobacteria bacterium]